ncbi:unnamed protein product, partial [Adineta steineri]
VIGIMTIEMIGGVYCPLSPRDPQHRLHTLVGQTSCRLVLIHRFTKNMFNDDITTFDISSILVNNSIVDTDQLSNITVRADNIAYVIFTSGSTGIPKAVQVRHKNFIGCMHSLVGIDTFNKDDTCVQMTRCSFDIHVQEILGESFSPQLAALITKIDSLTCTVWNLYGPAETTIDSIAHRVNVMSERQSIPIGQPFGNYRCLIMDHNQQSCIVNQYGELSVGGVGVFAGYLSRDDLSAKASIYINDELFYRTGDLVHVDNKGLIHYVGRKDYQIKLHGQRIELGEIERCLLNFASICACVVINWNDDHLVAYVQSSYIDENQLREHCQSHLPPYMIPSLFVVLDKLPLNANGKIDRKLLPPPAFLSSGTGYDSNEPSTSLEQQLQHIFSQAFHIESPPIDVPFGQLGGTSLDAIRALTLMRQQVYTNIDIGLLFANSSIRQLAIAIEPLLTSNQSQESAIAVNESHETNVRLSPSLIIESLGIILLICQWLWPIVILVRWCPFLFPFLPAFHLIFYVICSRLFSSQNNKTDIVFSWNYYRWWFLDRLWNNNTFWLQHILGTPFYNYYLRLCGARISSNAHINTTTIDAPWLLEVSNETWIADQTLLNCFHFNDDNTFELYSIRIGSNCSIGTRSILYDGVDMKDHIIVQPMSSVTGFIACKTVIDGEEHKPISSDDCITHSKRSLSIWHKIYQIIALILLICIHYTLLVFACKIYSIEHIPLPISIAFCWTLWSIIGGFVSIILLKFVVGSCTAGDTYSIASWSYLHKLWLRQLIVSSFHHTWLLSTGYDYLYPYVLRWLGAHIEHNVKLAEIGTFLSCPTNLLELQTGVTTFGSVLIIPTEMTLSGDYRVDHITFGAHTNLANGCTILPGSCLASETMVGNLTRISREINSKQGDVFIGVPARVMPFKMPLRSSSTIATADEMKIIPIWHTCFTHFISKSLLFTIYSLTGVISMLIIHTILICITYRYRSYIRYPLVQQIISRLRQDHQQFICPFLGNTQWLIHLFRALGAHIGEGVIIPDFSCLTDYYLVTIEDDVRLNMHANIQCHSFEQRILKLAPVTIRKSCVLMSGSFVMAGCKLMGNNRLYPFTLIMKNDLLLPNTQWKGLPAKLLTTKATSSQSILVCENEAEQQQSSENMDNLPLQYESIGNTYSNVDELQFMNYGYAEFDEHIDDDIDYCSKQLYKQVLAHVSLTNQNVLEVSCRRGTGAVWCVHNYVPRSYMGADLSPDVIDICRQRHSMISQLSFVVADATKYLPFENESLDIVLCVEATHAYGGSAAVQRFASEVARVLRPNGYFLWCDLCHIDGSDTSIDYLTANGELIVEEKINITKNVLQALDIQSNPRAEFIEHYVQSRDRELFRLFAGLPGTQMYNGMYEGYIQYWRAIFRKKTTTLPII